MEDIILPGTSHFHYWTDNSSTQQKFCECSRLEPLVAKLRAVGRAACGQGMNGVHYALTVGEVIAG
jgi:hypothetical protein